MSKYNLERLALKAILDDGTYNGDEDWWTSFTTADNEVYDVNVYVETDSENTARITVYPCIRGEQDNYITDTENEVAFFKVPVSTLMPDKPNKMYRVPFKVITEYYIDVEATDKFDAENKVWDVYEDGGMMISLCETVNETVKLGRYWDIKEI